MFKIISVAFVVLNPKISFYQGYSSLLNEICTQLPLRAEMPITFSRVQSIMETAISTVFYPTSQGEEAIAWIRAGSVIMRPGRGGIVTHLRL